MDNSLHSDKDIVNAYLMRLGFFAGIMELMFLSNTEFVLLISLSKILDFNSHILSVIED